MQPDIGESHIFNISEARHRGIHPTLEGVLHRGDNSSELIRMHSHIHRRFCRCVLGGNQPVDGIHRVGGRHCGHDDLAARRQTRSSSKPRPA